MLHLVEVSQVQPRGVTGGISTSRDNTGKVLRQCIWKNFQSNPRALLTGRERRKRALLAGRTRQLLSGSSQWIESLVLFASCPFHLPPVPCRCPNWSSGCSPLWPVSSALYTAHFHLPACLAYRSIPAAFGCYKAACKAWMILIPSLPPW